MRFSYAGLAFVRLTPYPLHSERAILPGFVCLSWVSDGIEEKSNEQ